MRKLLIFILFFFIYIFPTQVFAQKTIKVNTSGYAHTVDLKIGVTINDDLSGANNIKQYFPDGKIFLRIRNPTVALLSNPEFISLNIGYEWCFYIDLTDSNAVSSAFTFLDQYFNQNPNRQIILELWRPDLDQFDTPAEVTQFLNTVNTYTTRYPSAKINIMPEIVLTTESAWKVFGAESGALHMGTIPAFDSMSFGVYAWDNDPSWHGVLWPNDVFYEIKENYITIHDRSLGTKDDIARTPNQMINYPSLSNLSLSDLDANTSDLTKNPSFFAGITAIAIFNNVQMLNGSPATPNVGRITKLIYGNPFILTYPPALPALKILRILSDFIEKSPSVVWPLADQGNGDPWWYNPFLPGYNTDPVMGVGLKSGSEYLFLVTNATSTSTNTITFSPDVHINSYYSYQQDASGNVTGNSITLQPLEVMILTSSPVITTSTPTRSPTPSITHGPTRTPTPTVSPGGPTLTPSPTGGGGSGPTGSATSSATPTKNPGMFLGALIQFTGWKFLGDFDPLFLVIILCLTVLTVRIISR